MQTRLKPLSIKRERKDYPQVNYIDEKGIQWIEINRGCKRQCEFCYADPNYKVFNIPEIKSNKVQIIGENILYDHSIKDKLLELGEKKVNDKVVYYGICNGLDYRLLTRDLASICAAMRFGSINNKGNWRKGISIAWDLGFKQEKKVKDTIDMLVDVGFQRKAIMVHVLVNWKITYDFCLYKFKQIKKWDVMIDDCTWDCTKRLFIPLYWNYYDYKKFRKKCRTYNIGWSEKKKNE